MTANQFWKWFLENINKYSDPNTFDSNEKAEKAFDLLSKQMTKFSEGVTWELKKPSEDSDIQELTITANGDVDYFDKVEELATSAPAIKGWSIIAFKQPVDQDFISERNEVSLNTEDIYFKSFIVGDSNDFGVTVYLKNLDEISHIETVESQVQIILDTLVGERDFALYTKYLDIESLTEDIDMDELDLLIEIRNHYDYYIQQHIKNSR